MIELQTNHLQASNPRSTVENLRDLHKSSDPETRLRLAENDASPPDILGDLAKDPDPEVRACVASNSSTAKSIVEFLSRDEHDDVRFSMAGDPHLHPAILYKLAHDQNPYVRDRAQKTLDGVTLEYNLEELGFVSVSGTHARLGELLVASRVIDAKTIEVFAIIATSMRIPLGRALVQAGRLDKCTIIYALKLQTLVRLGQLTFEMAAQEINIYSCRRQSL